MGSAPAAHFLRYSGGSHSDCVILNERGERVGSSSGPGTNPWSNIGFEGAARELATMVVEAKREGGIPQDKSLDSLVGVSPGQLCQPLSLSTHTQGMALSGGEQEEGQRRIVEGISRSHPHTASHYHVCTDTFGSIATAFPSGRETSGEPG